LEYENGDEISPWTVNLGGEVFFNFASDALQFRPEGVEVDELMEVINEVYIPKVKGDPDLLNYPELGMYANFAEEAEEIGLPKEPYEDLVQNLQSELGEFDIPDEPPVKRKLVISKASLRYLRHWMRRLKRFARNMLRSM
jgi:hypothetical protein